MYRTDEFDVAHVLVGQASVQEPCQRTQLTLTKAELAHSLVDGIGLSMREAKQVVDAFFAEISSTLADGEEVKLHGFGNLKLREKGARPGRNPKTGEAAVITARRVVTFQASPLLKCAVSNGGGAATGMR